MRRQPRNSVGALLKHEGAPVNRTRGKLQALRNFHAGKHVANTAANTAKRRELADLATFLMQALAKRSTVAAARFVLAKKHPYAITNKSHWFARGVYVLWFDVASPHFTGELWLDFHGMPLRFAELRTPAGGAIKVSKWPGSPLEVETRGNWAPGWRAAVQRAVNSA